MCHGDRNPTLSEMLNLETKAFPAALQAFVKHHIDTWGPHIFRELAEAEWCAGQDCARLAEEEQRRGLTGLGPLPAQVERAIDAARVKAVDAQTPGETTFADGSGEISSLSLVSASDVSQMSLTDSELNRRAEQTMRIWERWQRLADVAFETVVDRWCADPGGAKVRLGAGISGLLRGDALDQRPDDQILITATALAERLIVRGPRAFRPLVEALQPFRTWDLSAAVQCAVALSLECMQQILDLHADPLRALSEAAGGSGTARWLSKGLLARAESVSCLRGPVHAFECVTTSIAWAQVIRDRRALAAAELELAALHRTTASPDHSLAMGQVSLSLARELGDRRREGRALAKLAVDHDESGLSDNALRFWDSALHIAKDTGDRDGEGAVLMNLAIFHSDRGSSRCAREFYEQALEISRELGKRRSEAVVLANLAGLWMETGDPCRAQALYEISLEISRAIGNKEQEGIVLGNLAVLHDSRGSPRLARTCHEEALKIHRLTGHKSAEKNVLGNLGGHYLETGELDRALTTLEAALEANRRIGDRRGEGIVLGNLAVLYTEIGLPRRADELYGMAVGIHREVANRRYEGIVLGNIALACKSAGERDRARGLLVAAIEIHRDFGSRDWEGIALGHLANLEHEEGNSERSRELHGDALRIFRELGQRLHIGTTLSDLAEIELDCGETESALAKAESACQIMSELNDSMRLHEVKYTLGRCLAACGRNEEARRTYRLAIDDLESWLRKIGPDLRQADLLDEAFPLFKTAVSSILGQDPVGQQDMADAFEIAERGKARSLLENIRSRELPQLIPRDLLQKRKNVEFRVRALQDGLLRERAQPEPREKMLEFLQTELSQVRRDHALLLRELTFRHPVYAATEGLSPPLPLIEVQRRIVADESTALLEYFVAADETYLWVIRFDHVQVVTLGFPERELEKRIHGALGPIREYHERGDPLALMGLSPGALYSLATDVLGPAMPHLKGVKRLLIVPSGPLYAVPFEMLVLSEPEASVGAGSGDASSVCYVASRFEVAYGPSATLLDPALGTRQGEGRLWNRVSASDAGSRDISVLAFGDPIYDGVNTSPALHRATERGLSFRPLPGTRREVRTLKRLFHGTKSRMRSLARESVYRRHAPDAELIHLGCHGVVDLQEPAYSGVVLSPGRRAGEDAFLQSFEIAETRLNRRPLVVISACTVAGGKLSASEGLLGLTRAFAVAGAGAVLASQWAVADEATADLMTCFYEHIAAGEQPITALAKAKRAMITLTNHGSDWKQAGSVAIGRIDPSMLPPSHPFFWAGFSLWGIPQIPGTQR